MLRFRIVLRLKGKESKEQKRRQKLLYNVRRKDIVVIADRVIDWLFLSLLVDLETLYIKLIKNGPPIGSKLQLLVSVIAITTLGDDR